MSFDSDVKAKNTNLYPVVVINQGSNNAIYLSTNSTTINGQYYTPILLSVPGLKESIDIEKRTYKISNTTIQLSNYKHNSMRFSETVGNSSLINQSVDIYWISPSVTTLDDAKHIYHGWILRYDMDSDKIKLVVEDRSQAKLHKDLPEILSSDAEVPDKFKLKPIPMVYGYVPKSPTVISYSPLYVEDVAIHGANQRLLLDTDTSVTPQDIPVLTLALGYVSLPIFVFDEGYISIAPHTGTEFGYASLTQYTIENNEITLGQDTTGEYDTPADAISINKIIAFENVKPSGFRAARGQGGGSVYEKFTTNTNIQRDGNEWIASGTVCKEDTFDPDFQDSLASGTGGYWWQGESGTAGSYDEKSPFNFGTGEYDETAPFIADDTIVYEYYDHGYGSHGDVGRMVVVTKMPFYSGKFSGDDRYWVYCNWKLYGFNMATDNPNSFHTRVEMRVDTNFVNTYEAGQEDFELSTQGDVTNYGVSASAYWNESDIPLLLDEVNISRGCSGDVWLECRFNPIASQARAGN